MLVFDLERALMISGVICMIHMDMEPAIMLGGNF